MKPALGSVLLVAFMIYSASLSAQEVSPDAQEHMDRARAAISSHQNDEAIREIRSALKISPKCADCVFQLLRVYQQLGAHKDALETAQKGLEIAPDDRLRSSLHDAIGAEISEFAKAGKMHHEDAEREFRAAIQLNPNNLTANYNLGVELLRENRDSEGIEVLSDYLKRAPSGPNAKDARVLIDNPRRAREDFAPADFSLVTKDGEYVTLDDIKGKVVLLDFWASWCAPCVGAVPSLQRLTKRYAKNQFTLISISVDDSDQEWQKFMNVHHMDWQQVLDRGGKLRQLFKVGPIPTYVLIDAEGIMRNYVVGSTIQSAAQLDDQVKKYLKNAQKLNLTTAGTGSLSPSSASAAPTSSSGSAPVPTAASSPGSSTPPVSSAPAPTSTLTTTRTPPASATTNEPVASAPSGPAVPAQTTPTVPTVGTLIVTSDPDGAEIYVDNNLIGNAPATLRLQPGRHTLRAAMPGRRQWSNTITAMAGTEARIRATLPEMTAGTASIQGRVLWNENPVAGLKILARECGAPAPVYGPATADAQGHFSITGLPDGMICLYTDSRDFLLMAPSSRAEPGQQFDAADIYTCKWYGPNPPTPGQGAIFSSQRPTLKWESFPGATGYGIYVWRPGTQQNYIYQKGNANTDVHIPGPSIQVDKDLPSGDYLLRADAFNSAGHRIGCSRPITFSIL